MTVFGLCWLGIFIAFLLDSVTVFSESNFIVPDHTKPCNLAGRITDAWAYVASATFDTLVFIAISWRLASTSMIGNSFKSFVRGEGLLGLSRALLRSGQIYYM